MRATVPVPRDGRRANRALVGASEVPEAFAPARDALVAGASILDDAMRKIHDRLLPSHHGELRATVRAAHVLDRIES